MFKLYVLLSRKKNRSYVGVTEDIARRLMEHNAGIVKSSKPYRPYVVAFTESFDTLAEAMKKEKYFKSALGRRKLKKILNNLMPNPGIQ